MSEHYSNVAHNFMRNGHVSTLIGGQWGSEAKGSAAAWVAYELAKRSRRFDIVTTNAGAQAGHTSVHKGTKRVVFHLPTAPLITREHMPDYGMIYLNAGSIIDPEGLLWEIDEQNLDTSSSAFAIHPNAAIITQECRDAENEVDSSQTKTASTRKGVGQALSRKVLRSSLTAKDHPDLKKFVRNVDLNAQMNDGKSVLVEIPQGVSLSLNHSGFYPYTTSRDCTVMSGLSDAGIHPAYLHKTLMVLRTFPIRVGNIVEGDKILGTSGGHYKDQTETSWDELGVEAEITTVTKRVRRVFTFSEQQVAQSFALCRPDVVMLTFCNYTQDITPIVAKIERAAEKANINPPELLLEWGPTTDDVFTLPEA